MSTGLTFGTISSLFGSTHHLITQTQYTMLVTVVIMSAVIPRLIGRAVFQPQLAGQRTVLTVEPEDEIDAVRKRA